jgi:hypothetical protein
MKKVNLFQILNIINMAMAVVETIKSKGSKQEKIDTAVDLAAPFVQGLEVTFGKDLLKEEGIKPLVEEYITAAKSLVNGIQKFKDLKVTQPPTV